MKYKSILTGYGKGYNWRQTKFNDACCYRVSDALWCCSKQWCANHDSTAALCNEFQMPSCSTSIVALFRHHPFSHHRLLSCPTNHVKNSSRAILSLRLTRSTKTVQTAPCVWCMYHQFDLWWITLLKDQFDVYVPSIWFAMN